MITVPRNNPSLKIEQEAEDGGCGIIKLLRCYKSTVVWSWGAGWEHVSVAPFNGRIPTWEDMCFLKDMFWGDDQWVVEFHPPASEYVNNMENCLHLWRPINKELPTPASILV